MEKLCVDWGFEVSDFCFFLVVLFCQVWLQCLSKIFDLRSSFCLLPPSSHHLGSPLTILIDFLSTLHPEATSFLDLGLWTLSLGEKKAKRQEEKRKEADISGSKAVMGLTWVGLCRPASEFSFSSHN
jgi:hypothetical protein